MQNKQIFLLFLIFIIISASCNYKFVTSVDLINTRKAHLNSNLDKNIKTICVKILENRTSESGIEIFVTNDIVSELIKSANISLTSCQLAQARLFGKINYLKIEAINRKGQNILIEQKVKMSVSLDLLSKDNEIIFSNSDIFSEQSYFVTGNKLETEKNKREAIKILSKKIAENFTIILR